MHNHSDEPLPRLSRRADDSHKGDYGRVLVIGGSRGMAGAPALAGMAALRSGAGLVTVAIPLSAQPVTAGFSPCYMTIPLDEDEQGTVDKSALETVKSQAKIADAIAIGPGMGQGGGVQAIVAALYRDLSHPLVVDADGLNALAASVAADADLFADPAGPRILTPHPGEFSRLIDAPCERSEAARIEKSGDLARRDPSGQTIVVLKGHRTVLTDGARYVVNESGNPGMATGGTGDCLTGIVVALAGQGLAPFDAARLATYVHGVAGDAAASIRGETSLIAADLIDCLGASFREHASP